MYSSFPQYLGTCFFNTAAEVFILWRCLLVEDKPNLPSGLTSQSALVAVTVTASTRIVQFFSLIVKLGPSLRGTVMVDMSIGTSSQGVVGFWLRIDPRVIHQRSRAKKLMSLLNWHWHSSFSTGYANVTTADKFASKDCAALWSINAKVKLNNRVPLAFLDSIYQPLTSICSEG